MVDTPNVPSIPKKEVEGWRPADPSTLPQPGEIDRLASDAFIDSAWRRAFTDIAQWRYRERFLYADAKFTPEMRAQEVRNLAKDPHIEEYVHVFVGIGDYMKRAQQFGLDSLQGRQALGKALITIESCLTAAIVAFGPMPEPGVPSGEIKEKS